MGVARQVGAVCGIAGPVAFVTAWAVGGVVTEGYDPLRDAISQLAREGADTRPLMNAGFIAFGLLIPVWAVVLGRELRSRPLAAAVTVAGVATFVIAGVPLTREGGQPQDVLHAVVAGTGYIGMALTPLLGAAALRRLGHERAAATSLVVGVVSTVALVASVVVTERGGGFQRLGLTVVDVWHVVTGLWVLRRR